jgi:hypothetical protein
MGRVGRSVAGFRIRVVPAVPGHVDPAGFSAGGPGFGGALVRHNPSRREHTSKVDAALTYRSRLCAPTELCLNRQAAATPSVSSAGIACVAVNAAGE